MISKTRKNANSRALFANERLFVTISFGHEAVGYPVRRGGRFARIRVSVPETGEIVDTYVTTAAYGAGPEVSCRGMFDAPVSFRMLGPSGWDARVLEAVIQHID